MLPHISPESIIRALRFGLGPLVFWQVTKRERKLFEADLTPEDDINRVSDKKEVSHNTNHDADNDKATKKTTTENTSQNERGRSSSPIIATSTAAKSRSRVETTRHVAELEIPMSRTPRGGVTLPDPWWKELEASGRKRRYTLAAGAVFVSVSS